MSFYFVVVVFFCNAESLYLVGFVETMYTVSEGDGQVEVCVTLLHSKGDISNKSVLVDVINNMDSLSIQADVAASKSVCTCS